MQAQIPFDGRNTTGSHVDFQLVLVNHNEKPKYSETAILKAKLSSKMSRRHNKAKEEKREIQ
jgi:hypothetical protein